MQRKRTPFSGWFIAVLIITVLTMAVLSGTRTLISYRTLALGGHAVEIGIITSVFAIVPLFIALPVGRYVDRGRGVLLLRLGSIALTIAVAIAACSQNLIILGVSSALLGIGQIFSTVAAQGLIALWSEPGEFDKKFGNLTLAVSTGQLIGFPIAGAIASASTDANSQTVSTTLALAVMAVMVAISIPFCFIFKGKNTEVISRKDHADLEVSSIALLKTKGMKPAIYTSLLLLTSVDILGAYLPLLGEQFGLSVAMVTALLTVRTIASVISRATISHLIRLVGRKPLLVGASLFAAIPCLALPFLPYPIILGILIFVFGFFFGVGQPLTMTWVTNLADESNRAAALAVRLAGNRIGQVVLPLGASAVAGFAGTGAIFVFMAALLFTATGVTFKSLRGTE